MEIGPSGGNIIVVVVNVKQRKKKKTRTEIGHYSQVLLRLTQQSLPITVCVMLNTKCPSLVFRNIIVRNGIFQIVFNYFGGQIQPSWSPNQMISVVYIWIPKSNQQRNIVQCYARFSLAMDRICKELIQYFFQGFYLQFNCYPLTRFKTYLRA